MVPANLRQPARAVMLIAIVSSAAPRAVAVAGWRGDGTGVYDLYDPPRLERPEWEAALPGTAHASPVVAGNRVVVLSNPDLVTAHALADGRELWRTRLDPVLASPEGERPGLLAARKRAETVARRLDILRAELAAATRRLRAGQDTPDARARLAALRADRTSLEQELAALPDTRVPVLAILGSLASTPVVDAGPVHVLLAERWVFTLAAADGRMVWAHALEERRDGANLGHHEGAAASTTLSDGRLWVPGPRLVELDAATGRRLRAGPPLSGFGTPLPVPGAPDRFIDGFGLRAFSETQLPPGHDERALLCASPVWTGAGALLAGSFRAHGPLALREVTLDGAATAPRTHRRGSGLIRVQYATPLVLGDDVWTLDEDGLLPTISRRALEQRLSRTLAARGNPDQAVLASPWPRGRTPTRSWARRSSS